MVATMIVLRQILKRHREDKDPIWGDLNVTVLCYKILVKFIGETLYMYLRKEGKEEEGRRLGEGKKRKKVL